MGGDACCVGGMGALGGGAEIAGPGTLQSKISTCKSCEAEQPFFWWKNRRLLFKFEADLEGKVKIPAVLDRCFDDHVSTEYE